MTGWRDRLQAGVVIPAHPLALNAQRKMDERRQRALTRYYLDAGAGGVAVGVHTTQFAIRKPEIGLYRPVLELAMEELRGREVIKVAGVCGATSQAAVEAEFAAACGYDAALVSLGGWGAASTEQLLEHIRQISLIIRVFGFYLQPAVGGCVLPYEFWRGFAELPNAVAIKIAPFQRYQTLDVLRAVADSGRTDLALYTGNDDTIVTDLLTPFRLRGRQLRIAGGLLGHWAVWTRRAVQMLEAVHRGEGEPPFSGDGEEKNWLTLGAQVTDSNAAFFDAANGFRGCIAGIHEVLRRQGLLEGRWCLDPEEDLSPGQLEQIDRVYNDYPGLNDDEFVREHLDHWLR
jgi:dihydrodipicolinate synthase/N-acetylneuraminate lyase